MINSVSCIKFAAMSEKKIFKPFVAPESIMKEFTLKAILVGCVFGIIFGAATVYLALKAHKFKLFNLIIVL